MTDSIYLHPLTLISGPQAVDGDAVRLGGSMAYAREFALVLRGADGGVTERIVTTAAGMDEAMARLPDLAAREAERHGTTSGKSMPCCNWVGARSGSTSRR